MQEIHEHVKQLSLWKCFLLARWCIRHCLYKLAIDLLQRLLDHVHVSIHLIWLETLIGICQGEERLQSLMNAPKDDLQMLCNDLAEAAAFYESSLIQMPVRTERLLVSKIVNVSCFYSENSPMMMTSILKMPRLVSNGPTVVYARRLSISSMNLSTPSTNTI
jgi:hypothetical protein